MLAKPFFNAKEHINICKHFNKAQGYSNGNEMKLVDYVYDKNKPEIQIIEVETDVK